MIATESTKVEIQQRFHRRADVNHNLELVLGSIDSSDSDLIIFPEMFLTGYTLGGGVREHALSINDPIFRSVEEACRENGKHVVFGFPERSPDVRGQIHNSAMVIGPEGRLATYRKMHLVDFGPFEEWAYFTPGDCPVIFEVGGFKFGLIICYDIFFPELSKHYALKGADAVICISASPSVTRPFFEAVMKARAIEDTVYFIYSNLVGFDSRMDFWGGGEIITPRGKTISKGPYFEESVIGCELCEDEISLARSSRPTLRDTGMNVKRALMNL